MPAGRRIAAIDYRRRSSARLAPATSSATAIFQSEGGLDPETGQGIGAVHWHQAAGAAEVEVDLETGKVDLLRYHAAVYAGRIINPVQAELQTEGNVAFGLGQALFEEMLFDDGQLQNGNLGDYMIASIEDMPPDLHLDVLERRPRGTRSTASARRRCRRDAGHRQRRLPGDRRPRSSDLPITPEKVLRGLQALKAAARPTPTRSPPRGREGVTVDTDVADLGSDLGELNQIDVTLNGARPRLTARSTPSSRSCATSGSTAPARAAASGCAARAPSWSTASRSAAASCWRRWPRASEILTVEGLEGEDGSPTRSSRRTSSTPRSSARTARPASS